MTPPKTVALIRKRLKAIHAAVETPPRGPHFFGMPKKERSEIQEQARLDLRDRFVRNLLAELRSRWV